MQRTFACRICAVMAACAVVHDIRVIKICRCPGDRGVAIVAVVAAGDMRRMLTDRSSAVVARATCAYNLRVVHVVSRHPGIGVVAVLANIASLDMCRILARRVGAIVAARAIAGDVDVIEVRGQPACCRVAVVAVGAAGYVRRMFADRYNAIMT